MKIVVLDGYATNPGDLSWDGLAAFGELVVYDRTPAEKTVERAAGAEILITNKVFLGAEELSALPGLIYIGCSTRAWYCCHQCSRIQHGVRGAACFCATDGTGSRRWSTC
jgi:glycerate dehydrogenase